MGVPSEKLENALYALHCAIIDAVESVDESFPEASVDLREEGQALKRDVQHWTNRVLEDLVFPRFREKLGGFDYKLFCERHGINREE